MIATHLPKAGKLKAKIQDKEGIPTSKQCMRWGEDELEDEATLSDWDGKMVYCQVVEDDEEEKKEKKEKKGVGVWASDSE